MNGDNLSLRICGLPGSTGQATMALRDGFGGGHLVISDLDVAGTACG